MTIVTIINLILIALCVTVIVQGMRMAKGIRDIRSSSLDQGVAQLESATTRAHAVLTELKSVLGTAIMAQNRAVADGEALRDELSVVIGIGNAVAERIVEAASAPTAIKAKAVEKMSPEKNGPEKKAAEKKVPSARRSSQRRAASRAKPAGREVSADIALPAAPAVDAPATMGYA